MEPIRQKLSALLTEAAHDAIETLDPHSPCVKELNKYEDVDTVIAEEVEKICDAITLAEITKILFLTRQLEKTSGQKKETIKSQLKKTAEKMVARVESRSGPMRLPQTCRYLLVNL